MAIKIINETSEERELRMYKINKRFERREKILGFFRFAIYSPLQILFSVISLAAKGMAFILSIPLIYFICKLIYIIFNGKAINTSDLINTLLFIVLPFCMFFIQQLAENISDYFYENKY